MPDSAPQHVSKKHTTVTVDGEVLKAAKAAGINLSATLEQALAVAIAYKRRREWHRENAEAVDDYNMQIRRRGAFGPDLRRY